MTDDHTDQTENATRPIAGLSLSDAVDAVADDATDPQEVRETLSRVADDGTVSQAAADEATSDVSKVVTTAETRVELASHAFDDACDAATPVSDLDVVRSRLETFESRLSAVETRADDVGTALQDVLQHRTDAGTLYDVARGLERITAEATTVQRTADDLLFDLEEFERWVRNPHVRFDRLEDDVDTLESALDELASDADADSGVAWADATLRHRVMALLLADVRKERSDLRTWANREDVDVGDRTGDIGARIDDCDAQIAAIDERLDEVERSGWRERFGDRLTAFERALDDVAPPVEWSDVQADLAAHRSAIEEST
jgi:chromosome segregation ATPase